MDNRQRNIVTVILIFILMSGLALRVINVGQMSFWVDELNHVYAAKGLLEKSSTQLPSGLYYRRALLYTTLVAASFQLFGDGEAQARLPSIIFGTVSIPLIFFLGLRWFSPWVGLLGAFLLAFFPPAVAWSRECRMYTMLQAISLVFLYVFYRGLEYENRQKGESFQYSKNASWYRFPSTWSIHWLYLLLACILLIIAYHLQQVTSLIFFAVLAYNFTLFVGTFFQRPWNTGRLSKYGFFLLVMVSLAGLAMILFSVHIRFFRMMDRVPLWAKWRSEDSLVYFHALGKSLWPFFVVGGIGILRERWRPGIYLLIMFLVPFLMLSILFSWKSGRYMFHLLPGFLLVSAYGISITIRLLVKWIGRAIARRTTWSSVLRTSVVNGIVAIIFLALLMNCRWFQYSIRIPWLQHGRYKGAITHSNWRGACQYAAVRARSGDIIISSNPLAVLYYGLPYINYSLNLGHLDFRRRNDQGRHMEPYTGAEIIADLSTLEQIVASHPKGWVIIDVTRLSPPYVTEEVRDYIFSQLDRHLDFDDDTVLIFSWDHTNHQRVSEPSNGASSGGVEN